MQIARELFKPSFYSDDELRFFLTHMGEAPIVALHKGVPPGVNPVTVRQVLGRITELEQLQAVHGQPWCGREAIKDSIIRYLTWQEKVAALRQRGMPPTPSRYMFDGARRAFPAGIGADGQFVISEVLPDGTRRKFEVDLLSPPDLGDGVAMILSRENMGSLFADRAEPNYDALTEDPKKGVVQCPICGKAFNYNPRQKSTRTTAMASMARHLKTAREEIDRHRILYTRLFRQ